MLVATHDGTFHADEVFAVAALQLLGDPVRVIRTRDRDRLAEADLRVDVGFTYDPAAKTFDHHQRDFAEARPNGVRFASFGLIWREFGARLCNGDEAVAAAVDEALVAGVDAHDTGQTLATPLVADVHPLGLGAIIGAFNPRWDESVTPEDEAQRFDAAVDLARGILAREIASATSGQRATEIVRNAIAAAADPRVIELNANVPWKRVVVTEAPDARFVIYPKTSGWGVQAIPASLGTFDNRLDLPADWAGLEGEALQTVTGVKEARFCHAARFLAVADTLPAVRLLADLALGERLRAKE